MSQALQSLNNILKYRLDRERQKIGESLSMMEVGTRLQQQKYDREFQIQTIKLRDAREKRDVSKSDKDNRALDLQIQSLQSEIRKSKREESPESIAYNEEMKLLAKKKAEQQLSLTGEKGEITKYQIDEIKKARVAEKTEKLDAALGEMQNKREHSIIKKLKDTNVLPESMFSIARDLLIDGEYSANDMSEYGPKILSRIKKLEKDKATGAFGTGVDRTKSKYIKKLINDPNHGQRILSGIIAYEMSKKLGQADGADLLESLDSFYIPAMQNTDFLKTVDNAGLINSFNQILHVNQISQNSKESIKDARTSGEFQISLDKISEIEVEKEMEELISRIAAEYGGSYVAPASDEEIDAIIKSKPHISREDFK
tara:strand:+ start:417 stop:1526 length:1110 start_codon:yes stop_codon:yes gene_type:complete